MSLFTARQPASTLRDELVAVILQRDHTFERELSDTTSLIRSGLIDSLGLIDIAVFVERAVGRPVDITAVDLSTEWDSVGRILQFIERQRSR